MLGFNVGVDVFLVEVAATPLIRTPTFAIRLLAPCSSALTALHVLQVVMQPLSAHFFLASGAFDPVLQGWLRRSLSTIAATTRGMLVLHLIQRPSCLGPMSADEVYIPRRSSMRGLISMRGALSGVPPLLPTTLRPRCGQRQDIFAGFTPTHMREMRRARPDDCGKDVRHDAHRL